MRNSFTKNFFNIAKKNKKLRLVAADISPAGDFNKFEKEYPNRFMNIGVSETSMISLCAGMAINGLKPFAYTIATFSLYRPFEMIRDDICYQNLPVTIVGMGAGTIYSNLGATHMSQEDISVARSVPNMQVISLCDSLEIKECLNFLSYKSKKPTYLRIGKSGEPNLTDKALEKWKFGKLRKIFNGEKICFIGHGPILKIFIDIHNELKKTNVFSSVYNSHTLKPFDYLGLKKIFQKYKYIFLIEDHSVIGGLQTIVKEYAFDKNFRGKVLGFSLKDEFIKCYGHQHELLKLHGISYKNILSKVKKFLNIY